MKKNSFVWILLMILTAFPVAAQQGLTPLSIDPSVRYGKLDNGLTYYIRHNATAKERAEFHIAQNVGSILELEPQRGLAHFLEHMAFNGTKNFPNKNLLNYLERNGVKFGVDLNAYTSIEQTVYRMSNVPVTRKGIIDSCLLILHDWSQAISLEEKEIDSERGVISEEWRTSTNATMRMFETILPQLYPGSQYGQRLPIGLIDVIQNFTYQDLRDYYHKWYRPDLQALIVVGDINVDEIEATIKKQFADVKLDPNRAEKPVYEVYDNKEPIVAIATDKEAPRSTINIYFKQQPYPTEVKNSVEGIMLNYVSMITNMMLNSRYEEIAQKANAPYLQAYSYKHIFFIAKVKDAFTLGVIAEDGKVLPSIEAVCTEMVRAAQHGFTPGEYTRAKANLLKMVETQYNERDKRKNIELVNEYISHFVEGDACPGIEVEYALYNQIAQMIPLEQINAYMSSQLTTDNVVISVMGPEKEGITYPTKQEIANCFLEVAKSQTTAYIDNVSTDPLIKTLPKKGKIKKIAQRDDFEAQEFTLSNGAKVIIKPTTHKADQILFEATSRGGSSLIKDEDVLQSQVIDELIGISGLGQFTNTELQKQLAGRTLSLTSEIDLYTESLKGNCAPKDLEAFMQILYLSFTAPLEDQEAFSSWKTRKQTMLRNQALNPMKCIGDSLTQQVYGDNPRFTPLDLEDVDKVNYSRAIELYKERFANAADFVFTFVGNVNIDSVKPLIEQYIASLPSSKKRESIIDRHMEAIPGVRKCEFEKKMQTPKSTVYNLLTTLYPYNTRNAIIGSMFKQILDIVYIETIREEEGGTYGVGTQLRFHQTPRGFVALLFGFDTNYEAKQKLYDRALEEIKKIATEGPRAKDLDKIKEYMVKKHKEDLIENSYFLKTINQFELTGVNSLKDYEAQVTAITVEDIKNFTATLVNANNQVSIIMNGIKE